MKVITENAQTLCIASTVVLGFQRPVMPELSTELVTYCAVQLQKEAREKEETLQRMLSAEKRVRTLEEDNRQLRREAAEVRKELDRLRKEVSQRFCVSICILSLLYGLQNRGEAYLIPTWLMPEQRLAQVQINQSINV